MLLARDFVFLHVPKTGGTFVTNTLAATAPEAWRVSAGATHGAIAAIPSSHARLPRLAFVRHPCSWYVSWFAHKSRQPDAFFRQLTEGGKLDFASTMRRVLGPHGPYAQGCGPFTRLLFDQLGIGLTQIRVGRFESLRIDLLRLLANCTSVPSPMAQAVMNHPEKNIGGHAPWQDHYDAGLRELVAARDEWVFATFGYAPNDELVTSR